MRGVSPAASFGSDASLPGRGKRPSRSDEGSETAMNFKRLSLSALLLLLGLVGSGRAQNPNAPLSIDTGLAPHFHLEKGGLPYFGPYKNSTLQDLPGGMPRCPRPTPWYMIFPASALKYPTGPMPFPYWPTMPPATGAAPMGQPMPGPMMGQGMMPPGMLGMPAPMNMMTQAMPAPGMYPQQPMMAPPGAYGQPPMQPPMGQPGTLPPQFQQGMVPPPPAHSGPSMPPAK